ncbi:MAG TPA: hypothetical protein VFV38_40045 [Ktedonobacteraceae bacterium]|nr:hypothetical protein [Ktedonobacteraceae bacterium]
MNNSWQAYENGLALLAWHISPEHPEYERFHALQTNLLENIRQPHSHSLPELSGDRNNIVADLNGLTRQAIAKSFIELCISTSSMLIYLTCTYQAAYRACDLYSGEGEIWPDQCEESARHFHERPSLAGIATDISDTTTHLYHIDQCIIDLLALIERFKTCCQPMQRSTERVRNKRIEIQETLKRCLENILDIDATFAEFIRWYQDDVLSTRCLEVPPRRLKPVSSSLPRDDSREGNSHSPAIQSAPLTQEKQQHILDQKQQENTEPPEIYISSPRLMAATPADRDDPVVQRDPVDREMHNRLMGHILKIPGIDDYSTRTDLLTGLPSTLSLPRNDSNFRTDISGLIRDLAPIQLDNEQWAILIFIENAISRVEGTKLAENLEAIHKEIKAVLLVKE